MPQLEPIKMLEPEHLEKEMNFYGGKIKCSRASLRRIVKCGIYDEFIVIFNVSSESSENEYLKIFNFKSTWD